MTGNDIKLHVFKKGAANKIPVSGTFELTPRCNLNCRMCYVKLSEEEQRQRAEELSTEEWISLGKDAVEAGMLYLLLTGGEPLIRQDFCQLYTAFVKMGLFVSINTNGVLLSPDVLNCLKDCRPEKVNVTLYGASKQTYSALCGSASGFSKALENILAMKEAGLRVNLNTTFTRYNIQDMEKIVDFAKKYKIPVRMSNYIFPPVRNGHETQGDTLYLSPEEAGAAAARFDRLTLEPEVFRKRREIMENLPDSDTVQQDNIQKRVSACMAGRGAFWLSWNGEMYPCAMLSDFSVSMKRSTFLEAWKTIQDYAAQMYLPAECSTCGYRKICRSCAAVSQSVNHKTDAAASDMCRQTKAYVDAVRSLA